MDILKPIVEDILKDVLAAGAIRGAKAIEAAFPGLDLKDNARGQRDAAIQNFFGNAFPDQLIKIHRLIQDALAQQDDNTRRELVRTRLGDYYSIQTRVNLAREKYENFIDDKRQTTWNEFAKAGDLDKDLLHLFEWIAPQPLGRRPLQDDIADICEQDFARFKHWQHAIMLLWSAGCLLKTAFHYHTVYPEESYTPVGYGGDSSQSPCNADLPLSVRKDMRRITERSQTVVAALDKKYRELKTSFLTKMCGDRQHKDCGAESDNQCCEISAKVYKALKNGDNSSTDNKTLAALIANMLRNDYRQFSWSVVIMEDYQSSELQINHEHHADIWLQRSGSRRPGWLQKSITEKSVMSDGLGLYGYLLCYRVRQKERAALVFWVDPTAMKVDGIASACNQLRENWQKDQAFRQLSGNTGAGSVYRVTGYVRELKMNYVFGVGLSAKAPEKPLGVDLTKEDRQTFSLDVGR